MCSRELKIYVTPLHHLYVLIRFIYLILPVWQNFCLLLPQQCLTKIKLCRTGEDLLPLDTPTYPLQFLP